MEIPPKRVEEFLHQRIPAAKAMNCQIVEATDKAIRISVPKFVNTVCDEQFSDLAALSLGKLSCWTFLQLSLQRLDYTPLITLSEASFSKNREVDSNSCSIIATCRQPGDKEWQQFLRMLSRKARAKVSITAELEDDLGIASVLTCEYDARDLDPA